MISLSVEKPEKQCGIYAWVNESERVVYIGESIELNRRICEHILSIYGYERSSNENLVNAAQYIPFKGIMLYYPDMYKKTEKNKQWLIDETIYMYIFVKEGYRLLNGTEEFKLLDVKKDIHGKVDGKWSQYPTKLTDNTGNSRNFLRQELNDEELFKELVKYCETNDSEINDTKVNEQIEKAFKRFEEKNNKKDSNNIYYFEKENCNTLLKKCNEIRKAFLRKQDLEAIGIKPLHIDVFKNNLNKIAVCGFGDYFDQSTYSILITKLYDIMNNKMSIIDEKKEINFEKRKEEDQAGICLWAYGKNNTSQYRNYLIVNGENSDKSSRYLLLPYVHSKTYAKSHINYDKENDRNSFNYQDDCTIKEFFEKMRAYYNDQKDKVEQKMKEFDDALSKVQDEKERWEINRDRLDYKLKNDYFTVGCTWDSKNKKNIIKYPDNMFPQVVQKVSAKKYLRNKSNVAFLISELNYLDVPVEPSKIFEFFTSSTGKKLCNSLSGPNNVAVASLTNKKGIDEYFDNIIQYKSNEVKMLVAKIEYPYVIALV